MVKAIIFLKNFLKSIVKSIISKKKYEYYCFNYYDFWSILFNYVQFVTDYGQLWWIIGNFGWFLWFFGPLKCIFGENLVNYMSLVINFGICFYNFFWKIVFSSQGFTQSFLEADCQGNYFLNYYFRWFGQARFWVKSRSKPGPRGQGSLKGLDSSL